MAKFKNFDIRLPKASVNLNFQNSFALLHLQNLPTPYPPTVGHFRPPLSETIGPTTVRLYCSSGGYLTVVKIIIKLT